MIGKVDVEKLEYTQFKKLAAIAEEIDNRKMFAKEQGKESYRLKSRLDEQWSKWKEIEKEAGGIIWLGEVYDKMKREEKERNKRSAER